MIKKPGFCADLSRIVHKTGSLGIVTVTSVQLRDIRFSVARLWCEYRVSDSNKSFKRQRFPRRIIAHSVWLYVGFHGSLHEVEELLSERGIDVSIEAVRRWTIKVGPQIAKTLSRRRVDPGDVWHLDVAVVEIWGKRYWPWRAVDKNGLVLGEVLQNERNKTTEKRLLIRPKTSWL